MSIISLLLLCVACYFASRVSYILIAAYVSGMTIKQRTDKDPWCEDLLLMLPFLGEFVAVMMLVVALGGLIWMAISSPEQWVIRRKENRTKEKEFNEIKNLITQFVKDYPEAMRTIMEVEGYTKRSC